MFWLGGLMFNAEIDPLTFVLAELLKEKDNIKTNITC